MCEDMLGMLRMLRKGTVRVEGEGEAVEGWVGRE